MSGNHAPLSIVADTENLESVFNAADAFFEKIKWNNLCAEMEKSAVTLDPVLFGHLFSFQAAMQRGEYAPGNSDATARRLDHYKKSPAVLSEIFADKCAECVEMALAAQAYLIPRGYDAAFISGNVHWHKNGEFLEFNEPHSFLLMHGGEGSFIYDPANPLIFDGAQAVPSVYSIPAGMLGAWENRASTEAAFMHLKNMISKKDALFGMNAPELSYMNKSIISGQGTDSTPAQGLKPQI